MMFDAEGRLDIFESFITDRSLPKYTRKKDVTEHGFVLATNTATTTSNLLSFSQMIVSSGSTGVRTTFPRKPRRWWQRLTDWLTETRQIPIEEFFRSVKNGTEELEMVDQRLAGYAAALEKARKNGQTALVELLTEGVEATRAETQLVAMKRRKFLSEAQIVEFVKRTKRGLRLDWLANFARVVPDNVVAAKVSADERHVFDNYVVLHFDPQRKAWAETQAEKERRKDPILFGLIRGRRRLYFVGDWTDEYCDLTFDQLADTLGKDAVGEVTKDFAEAG